MARILFTLTSSPESEAGRRALALAGSLAVQGHVLTLCCLQDAVLLGSDRAPAGAAGALRGLLTGGARCLVAREDLALRGLHASTGASALDYPDIVATLAGDHDRVIGAL